MCLKTRWDLQKVPNDVLELALADGKNTPSTPGIETVHIVAIAYHMYTIKIWPNQIIGEDHCEDLFSETT